jgi:serine/threonine protein kinase
MINSGLSVGLVIGFVWSSSGRDIDHVSLGGSYLHPGDPFDDFYESESLVFVFSKPPAPKQRIWEYIRDISDVTQIRVLGSVALVDDHAQAIPTAPRAGSQGLSERFFWKIEALFLLKHPRIARIVGYSLVSSRSPARIGTEFAKRASLRAAFPRLSDTATAIAICGIAMAMSIIHSRGVMHRGLKPENILLDDRGSPRSHISA